MLKPVLQVLMHTGPEGLTLAELIEKANSLGLAEPAWEPTTSKKSHLSTVSASSHAVVASSQGLTLIVGSVSLCQGLEHFMQQSQRWGEAALCSSLGCEESTEHLRRDTSLPERLHLSR